MTFKAPGAAWGSLFGAHESFRQHPHRGADSLYQEGAIVGFPCDAIVSEVFWSDVLGWTVEFIDAERTHIQASHLAEKPKSYRSGDEVKAGRPLGRCGNTGSASTGAHVHWAMSKKAHPHLVGYNDLIDPKQYWETRQEKPAAKPATKPKAKK
jgi:hypothetical protein